MGFFLIFLLLICLMWPWIGPRLSRWFRGFMTRRAEDAVRRMMGMPSRKEEERARRRASGAAGRKERDRQSSAGRGTGRRHPRPTEDAAEMLKSVAEDVEFTEIKEFESTEIGEDKTSGTRVWSEEQVSDVEYTEFKISRDADEDTLRK